MHRTKNCIANKHRNLDATQCQMYAISARTRNMSTSSNKITTQAIRK